MKEFKLSTVDDKILNCYVWDDVKKPLGVIQLVHGSAEYLTRYDQFGQEMNKKGFIVVGDDHRGHGKTALDNGQILGYFDAHNGWKKIVDDELVVNDYIEKNFPDLPVFMLGHSMGSFMARNFAIKYSQRIDGLILSGTTDYNSQLLFLGSIVSRLLILFNQGKKPSKLLWNASYRTFNKKFNSPKANGSEWQTANQAVQLAFANDPLCGFVFTTSGFKDLFYGLNYIRKKKNIELMRKDLPILILAGLDDPVGEYGKNVQKVATHFIGLNYDTKVMFYPNLRHEILFEPDHKQVEKDLLKFMKDIIH